MLSPAQAVEDINLSNEDCVSVFSLTPLSSETFEDDLSFPGTESVSEDNYSVNYQFVNDSEVYSNLISQVDAELNFALTLHFSRSLRLLRDGVDVIIIHKKKRASENERMMALFTAIKWG